jgi:hypothetical protein
VNLETDSPDRDRHYARSGAIQDCGRNQAVRSVAEPLSRAILSPRLKEPAQQRPALLGAHTAEHLGPVIQPGISHEVAQSSHHPGLVIPRTKDQPVETRQHHRAGAHGARLERDVQRTSIQLPSAERGRGASDRENFGMSGGILVTHGAIGSARQRLARAHDDGTHGNVAVAFGGARFFERDADPALIVR